VLPLGLDTLAVSAALGMIGLAPGHRARVSALFTAFEAGMPLIGLSLGAPLGHAIGKAADYLAIAVLLALGLQTMFSREQHEHDRLAELSQPRGLRALLLGLSISLDELAIGFTLGLLRLPAALVIAVIALQTFLITQLSLRLGSRITARLREVAGVLAGVALTALGIGLLLERLLG
jgi:putative Mn2+ efflux pump MntP